MKIRPVVAGDRTEWIRMRSALWPDSPGDHPPEIDQFFTTRDNTLATFVAEDEHGAIRGFIEAGTRPYAEGCLSSPVGYIEGWWVDPDYRRMGVGSALVAAAESWARALGLTEMASDADVANSVSEAAHLGLGYREAQRIVCFCKVL